MKHSAQSLLSLPFYLLLAACLAALALLPAGAVAADPPASFGSGGGSYQGGLVPTYKNLKYANASSSEVLDLFIPSGTGPFPVIVNIHGGGFMIGSKEMLDVAPAKAFLKNGYGIASINYRLSGQAKFPAAVEDAKAAVRFLRANAKKYKLNPNEIVAFGQSAGANIAQMLGVTSGVTALEGSQLGDAKYSSKVQAVINWFGPSNFALMDAEAKAQGCTGQDVAHNSASSPESTYLGAALPTIASLVQKSNPITYVDKNDAPTLLEKGTADCTVPIQQSVIMYNLDFGPLTER